VTLQLKEEDQEADKFTFPQGTASDLESNGSGGSYYNKQET
jgi:hypothetical protein